MKYTSSLLFLIAFCYVLTSKAQIETVVQFGHIGYNVVDMELSPDSKFLATTDGQILKIWELGSGLEYRTIASRNSFFPAISSLEFSKDGDHILFVENGEVKVVNFKTGKVARTWSLAEDSTDEDEEAEPTDEDLKRAKNLESYFKTTYSPDRSLMVLASNEHVEVLEVEKGATLHKHSIGKGVMSMEQILSNETTFFEITPDNKSILVDTAVYDLRSGDQKYIITDKEESFNIKKAIFSQDGQYLLLAGYTVADEEKLSFEKMSLHDILQEVKEQQLPKSASGLLLVLDVETGGVVKRLEPSPIFTIALNKEGNRIAMVHSGEEMKIYDWPSLQFQQSIKLEKGQLAPGFGLFGKTPQLLFSNDDQSLFLGGLCNTSNAIAQYSLEEGIKVRSLGASIPPISLHPEISKSDSIILKELEMVPGPLPFSPFEYDKGFRMLDLLTGKVPNAFARYSDVIFSPDKSCYLTKPGDEPVKIYTTEFDEKVSILENSQGAYDKFIFSPNSKWVSGIRIDEVFIWETATGRKIQQLSAHDKQVQSISFSQDEKMACTVGKDEVVRFWSVEEGELLFEKTPVFKTEGLKEVGSTIKDVSIILKKERAKIPSARDLFKKRKKEEPVTEVNQADAIGNTMIISADLLAFNNYYDVTFSPDGKIAALWGDDYATVHFYSLEKQKSIKKVKDINIFLMRQFTMGSFSEKALTTSISNTESDTIDVNGEEELFATMLANLFEEDYNLHNKSAISPDWTRFAWATQPFMGKKDPAVKVVYIEKVKGEKRKFELEDSEQYKEGLAFSPDGNLIAASNRSDNTIRIWNAYSGEIVKDLSGHSGDIAFGPSSKILISQGWDKQIKIWDIDKAEVLYSFIGIKGENDYIVMLPSGYYTASRKNTNAIAFRKGEEVYPFEQFDLQFNRPDILLETFTETSVKRGANKTINNQLIGAYQQAYRKRLESMSMTETFFDKDFHLPMIKLSQIPFSTEQQKLNVSFSVEDNKYELIRVNLYVNGVPLYGRNGKTIKGKTYEGQAVITLSPGVNKIQAVATNSRGVRSLMDEATIDYRGKEPETQLHLVLLGASHFADASISPLSYPAKDLEDIEKLFTQISPENSNREVVVHHFVDEAFTRANFGKLKKVLENTKVNDQVIIFFATHGLLDANLEYYLSTYDTRSDSPSNTALSFTEVEDLLDAITARNKVVFIDACHAGEGDGSEVKALKNRNTEDGVVSFRSLGTISWGETATLSNIEQMKSLFVGLQKNTGATVIASAGSTEFAMEGPKWNNSVFTYAFLKGIQKGQADLNYDGKITISELQDYLPRKVSQLTSGGQLPTFRYENMLNDWRVW